MAAGYRFVDGDSLCGFVFSVREEFLARIPYELDEERRPNCLRLVALDCLESRNTNEQLAILTDLLDLNPALAVERTDEDIFRHAATVGDYIADLVCAVVAQILRRDECIREKDNERLALSAESLAELEEQ
ncbi:MAG TPA: hypothetical protein VHY18_12010 [Solirubrobacteraceae bacterium]|jgi:hypothetical protein|nr:hypothetical protein [Solirubrobacteraceae bacterium]